MRLLGEIVRVAGCARRKSISFSVGLLLLRVEGVFESKDKLNGQCAALSEMQVCKQVAEITRQFKYF